MARFPFGKRKLKIQDPPATPPLNEPSSSVASPSADSEYRHSYLSKSPALKPAISLPAPGSHPMPDTVDDHIDDYPEASAPLGPAPGNASTPWRRHKLYDSPFPRYRHSVSQVASEKNEIFLMGGLKEGNVFGDTWKIVPHASGANIDRFTATHIEVVNKNNPPARVGHASVLCGNAYIIYGGDTVDTDYNGFPDDNFYMFNINNHKYTIPLHILNKPRGRYGHSIGVVSVSPTSSRLYLFGGQLENEVFNDLYYFELTEFKLAKARWELVEPLNSFSPPPLTNHSMCVHKNKIYVFGGVYNNEKVSNDLWCYDTLINKWLQIDTTGSIPLPVNEHSAVIANDHLYVYGGNDFAGIIYDTLYALDLHTFKWSKLSRDFAASGPGPRCGHTVTFLPKLNKLIIMGGDKNDYISSDPDSYDTHEELEGTELGTMIFELDLHVADHFLRGGSGKKAASAIGSAYGRRTTSPGPEEGGRHRRSFSAGPEDFRTPTASVERIPRSLDPKLSASEQFEPAYTPQRQPYSRSSTAGGDFVDVDIPSSAISQKDGVSDLEGARDKYLAETESPYKNGHDDSVVSETTPFDNLRSENNETPILSKDFARDIDVNPDAITTEQPKNLEEPTPNGGRNIGSFTPQDDTKLKRVIADLNNEIAQLKQSTKAELESTSARLRSLEGENSALKDNYEKAITEKDAMIDELRRSIDPADLEIAEGADADAVSQTTSKRGFTELTKYKLDRLELRNRLVFLEKENAEYRARFERFEPFMENQIGELNTLQKVIEGQENKIETLTAQIVSEEALHKEITEWKHKYEELRLEHENFKAVHAEVVPEDGEGDETSRSIGGHSKLSAHLANLTSLWKDAKRQDSDARLMTSEENATISKLQKQIDELMATSKTQHAGSSAEVKALEEELTNKLQSLRTFEQNYRDALQSVNNTSKALELSHEELRNQKLTIEKLIKENNELKLFKKANRRVSSKSPLVDSNGDSPAPGTPAEEAGEAAETDDEDGGFTKAHYNMKLKDLEADLYILKQEKEQLNDTVASLKKELYLAKNSS